MLNAYIYDGLRTPFGRHAGSLAKVRPDDLAAHVIKALVAKHNLPADIFDDVILGNTNQAGEDSRNIARHATLLAGLDVKTPAQTVNRLCASGLAAVIDAARAITCNEGISSLQVVSSRCLVHRLSLPNLKPHSAVILKYSIQPSAHVFRTLPLKTVRQ